MRRLIENFYLYEKVDLHHLEYIYELLILATCFWLMFSVIAVLLESKNFNSIICIHIRV